MRKSSRQTSVQWRFGGFTSKKFAADKTGLICALTAGVAGTCTL